MTKDRRQAGFTLLELLLVLTIIGLTLTVVPPMLSNAMPTLTLRGAAQDLALAFNQARGRAITRNQTQEVRLLPRQGAYVAGAGPDPQELPKSIRLSVEQAVPLDQVTGEQAVRFYPDGSSSGGLIGLSNQHRGYQLRIDWLTGRVRIQEAANDAG